MGNLENRLSRLENRTPGIASVAEAEYDGKLRRQRAIMIMILDEFAHLKASGAASGGGPATLAQAVRNVAAVQYQDLGKENYEYIADGWIETLTEWTRLDWLVKAGREGPPHA